LESTAFGIEPNASDTTVATQQPPSCAALQAERSERDALGSERLLSLLVGFRCCFIRPSVCHSTEHSQAQYRTLLPCVVQPQAKSEKHWSMIKIKKSTFSTDEHEDSTHGRSASITKDYVTLHVFTYKNDREITPVAVKKEALKELTALYPYNFLDDTNYKVYQAVTEKKYYY
jgi:hypothetical protein